MQLSKYKSPALQGSGRPRFCCLSVPLTWFFLKKNEAGTIKVSQGFDKGSYPPSTRCAKFAANLAALWNKQLAILDDIVIVKYHQEVGGLNIFSPQILACDLERCFSRFRSKYIGELKLPKTYQL